MINITTEPTEKTTKASYKINKSFSSLQDYIECYKIPECKSNAEVVSDTKCLKEGNYLPTTIYSYRYGECLPYGTIQGDAFTKCNRAVINERKVGIIDGYLCNDTCICESATYGRSQTSILVGNRYQYRADVYAGIAGGICPIAYCDVPVVDRLIWPCTSTLDLFYTNHFTNPVQLSDKVWVCYGGAGLNYWISTYPINPIGTTLMMWCMPIQLKSECKCLNPSYPDRPTQYNPWCKNWANFPPGLPIWFFKDGKCFIDTYCPNWLCVCLNGGGKVTLQDYVLQSCGAHPNNILTPLLPMNIDRCFYEDAYQWLAERCSAGYCTCAIAPSAYDGTYYFPYTLRYCYEMTVATYYTFGENCYDSDISQILFKSR